MGKKLNFIIMFSLLLAGCNRADTEPLSPQTDKQATAQAVVAQMQGASTAADGANSTNNTADYLSIVTEAQNRWHTANIQSYRWQYTHVNPAAIGQQRFDITVEDGIITKFDHQCAPEDCTLLPISDQVSITPQGLFDQLIVLAEQRHTMALIRFDKMTGLPLTITADTDDAPYYIQWNTDDFELIE